MRNTFAFDKDFDSPILDNSYNSIRNKSSLTVVVDEEKQSILKKVLAVLTVPTNGVFSILNLFKIRHSNASFHISQCLIDYGFPVGSKLSQSYDRAYEFQVIGHAVSSLDLGETFMRQEKKTDKWFSFLTNDIDIDNAEKFNDKYYLISNRRTSVVEAFDKAFCDKIAKTNDLILMTKGHDMFLTFENQIKSNQTRHLEDIFCSYKFLV